MPSLGRVRLRLSAKSTDKSLVEDEMKRQIEILLPQIEDVFVGYEEDLSLEALIGKQLVKKEKTLAVAESCTGGNIAQAITANAGASKYFKGSVVTYATATKINVLGVSKEDIIAHSVVSEQVAKAMAKARFRIV